MSKIKEYTKGNEGLIAKVAIAGLAYIGIVHPLLKAVGLFKSKEEKAQEQLAQQNATSTASPFNPNYYKGKPGAALLTRAAATSLADSLYSGLGFFNDKEATIYGVFRQLKAKTQVSFLADVFFQKYQRDLYGYLSGSLDDAEMLTVNQIVHALV